MATPVTDTRNLRWKSSNVGSKLLEKMGWKDGQAIGKRRDDAAVSSEGLRMRKRADQLGLGASTVATTTANKSSHTQEFATILQSLQQTHATTATKKKKRKSKKSPVLFSSTKATHAKVRNAKFQEKSPQDMQCIFGAMDFPVVGEAIGRAKRQTDEKHKTNKRRREEGA